MQQLAQMALMRRGAPAPPPLRLGALLVLCSLSGLAVPVGSGSAAGELSAAAWAASMPRAAGRRQRRSVRDHSRPKHWRRGSSRTRQMGHALVKLSASERYPPTLLLSFPLSFWRARGRNAWSSAAAHRGSCFAPSSEQTGSRTRGRSSSHAPAALAAHNLWSTHTLLDLFFSPSKP